ncbi:hypothetical protein TNCV_4836011 [Trichonephila clavipes]|nr:hypothetical protein TNCV_4836011 [Trichonephila clavipes]
MRKKGGNYLVPGPDYMGDALKIPSQGSRVSSESLQTRVAWHCSDETQHVFCWPILAVSGQSLASNGPVIGSRDPTEVTHNKLFLSRSTKYTEEPSRPLVLVWLPFELLHCALTMIVFAHYYRM